MPSVDPITPPSSTTAGTTGLFGALVPQQVSGLFGELMAMVSGTLGEVAAATPSTDAEPTTTTPTQTTGQRRRTLLDTDTGSTDLAAALAVLAGGANQTPALSAALASPASLGAAADTRSRTSDPSAAIGAPTAATGFATQTPTTTTASTPATAAAAAAADAAVAAAAAATTAPRTSTPAAATTPTTDTATPTPTTTGAPTSSLAAAVAGSAGSAATTTNTAAATASTATAADQALPPALASAIAGATGVATMPSALRHLSGTRVSGATAAGATTTGSTAATAATASEASATSASTTATDVAAKSTEAAASADTPAPVIHTAGEPRSAGRGDAAAAPIHAETGRGVAEAREPVAEATSRADAAASVATTDRPAAGVDADRRERAGAEAPIDGRASLDQPLLAVTGETGRDRIATAQTVREAASDPTRATTTLAQLPEAIAARSSAGHSRFDIRLSPAELGSVDVRVEVRASGEVRAHLVVERTETLDLMLRDQKHLERSLSDAGLDVGSSGLQFSLRQQPSGENGQGWRTYDDATVRPERVADEEAEATVAPIAAAAYRSTRIGGVDLRV